MMGRGGRELRKWLVGLPGLEPGDLILIRVLPRACFRRIAPTTYANDLPLETIANRSEPMACGPNVDQTRPLAGAAALRVADLGWQHRPPPAAPEQASPPGNRLARGALAGRGQGHPPG